MAVAMQEKTDGKILVVRASGKLTREDYEHFVPEVEHQVGRHGKVRILFDLHDFHGWTAGALWQDTKFAWRHFRDIDRLALIGEKTPHSSASCSQALLRANPGLRGSGTWRVALTQEGRSVGGLTNAR
jgi:hypothetical protein